jgi:hypothetical protein
MMKVDGKGGTEMSNKELRNDKATLTQLGVCACACHIEGAAIMHVQPCCNNTYKKYIHVDGTFDAEIVNEIVRKNFHESINLSNTLSIENENIIHPMGHAND